MKDFDFAKRIYELRKSSDESQSELAKILGVTNKAISKWENAEAMPSINQLVKLADHFNITIDDILNGKRQINKKIYKIVLTGGPCSGKSTALNYLQENLTRKGYMVLIVPETATELILGGITPWTIDNNTNFESYIIKLQLEKEKIFEDAAKHVSNYDKVIILCDRGVVDCRAYMSDHEYKNCLKKLGLNEINVRDDYDAVFHLVTAAKGAREFYDLTNNVARYESADEAIKRDNLTLGFWTGHPHLRVIDNSTDFENKIKRLKGEIMNFIGDDAPYEIERKFLIEYPDISKLEKLYNCQKVDLIQTYLKSEPNEEVRIRQRGQNGNYTYYKTTKTKISSLKRVETEDRITKEEYLKLLLQADTRKRQIIKTRYCLMFENQYFEIDIFEFWKDRAIIEIELKDENQKIKFPKQIKIIGEVTGDENYYNYNLASNKNI